MTVVAGTRVVVPGRVLEPGWVRVDRTRIAEVGAGSPPHGGAVVVTGSWVVPGFVDAHVHGGDSGTYTAGDPEQAHRAFAFHRRHGTTSSVASLVTAPLDQLERAVRG
ncbi:MAG: N-acetylglucosamine-6-phosphate deacetylase, partial [Actinomycetota bacterium]|nr:N-acetylglucosamine-6-phosphate deacetylase [Actinomycetota bacterium]